MSPTVLPTTPAAERVLRAASRLFYERGINTVGMDLIAATAQVTKKTIYDRFGSKEALITAYLHARDTQWRQWLTARLDSPDPARRVLQTFTLLGEWSRDNQRGCAMLNAHAELPDPRHPARQVIAAQKAWLRDQYLAMGTAAGAHDPATLAAQLVMLHEGAAAAHHVAAVPEAWETSRQAAVALLGAHGVTLEPVYGA